MDSNTETEWSVKGHLVSLFKSIFVVPLDVYFKNFLRFVEWEQEEFLLLPYLILDWIVGFENRIREH